MPTGFSVTGALGGGVSRCSMPSSLISSNPLFIRARVNGTHHPIVIDTGSGFTLINRNFLRRIAHPQFRSIHKSYASANCTSIEIIGEVLLEITVNNLHTYVPAAVATNLVTDVLLGTDWINRYVSSIDIVQQKLHIHDDKNTTSTTRIFSPHTTTGHSLMMLTRPHTRPQPYRPVAPQVPPVARSSLFQPEPHRRASLHQCYVCHASFLSNNDLYRHLREKCYPAELRDRIDALTAHIQPIADQQRIRDILWKHGKLLDTSVPSQITTVLQNAINTGTHRPVHTPPYRRSPKDHDLIHDQTQKLSQQNCIEPSTSPWCSPVVLVRKKDGGTRFCVDYRKLNSITLKDSFPLPRIDDIFDRLSGSHYFTKLDFKSGYFQVPLAPEDRPKTAFSTRDNHYQFTVLPQGIRNGPPTFQRIVNQILGPHRRSYCLAYIDDIIVFSRTFDEHVAHLTDVLHVLSESNFRLNGEKCTIATDAIDYLGHHIRRGEIRPNTDNIRGLIETTLPITPSEIFRFVKAAEYYRKFIPNFSRIAGPLYKYNPSSTTRGNPSGSKIIQLSDEEQHAFHTLKRILTTDLVLRLPRNDLPFTLQTDASSLGIGAVLLQTYPEGDRPVCYMSKKFTPNQQRWSTIEQECFAVIHAIEQCHHYLHGQHFVLDCDHKPLESLMCKPQQNNKCERWRLRLQAYDFTIKHIKGVLNTMPDYLSRSPVDAAAEDSDDEIGNTLITTATQTDFPRALMPPVLPFTGMVTTRSRTRQALTHSILPIDASSTNEPPLPLLPPPDSVDPTLLPERRIDFTGDLADLKVAQQNDPHLVQIFNNINHVRYQRAYSIVNGLLMHRSSHHKPVPYVPSGSIRRDIVTIYHDTPANGAHFGRDKTLDKIRCRYYWPNMTADIRNYVQSCLQCSANNALRQKPPGHLKPIAPPGGVWELLTMDFHGPISPTSRRGNRYIIALTDVLSKFVIAQAVPDCTAHTAARFLQEEVVCKYGTPKCILTDNGTHFTAALMNSLFQRLGIVHLYSTPYHPQTNGQIERFNGTMDAKIAALSNNCRSDWDEQLPFVIFNYNASPHSTTKTTPFELMHGRVPVFPFDVQNPMVSIPDDPHFSHTLRNHISNLTRIAHSNITGAQRQYKSRFDSHRSNPEYAVNDVVLVRTVHPRRKFDVRYEGPYMILQRLAEKTYRVQHVRLNDSPRQVTVDSIIPLVARRL